MTSPADSGSQAGSGQPTGQRLKAIPRILRSPAPLALGAFVIGAALFVIFGNDWWPDTYGYFGGPPKKPDATVLISTLVLVYTFFVAAYGALAPLVVGKGNPFRWDLIKKFGVTFCRVSVLGLIAAAVVLDLVRIANSIGDLYTTTMQQLPPPKVHDAADEFVHYLIINATILVFALIIAFWPEGSEGQAKAT